MMSRFPARMMVLLTIGLLGVEQSRGADRALDFNRDIRPILSENCFACHGFDEKARQADLRLDVMDSAYADRDGSIAIVPGSSEKSDLWKRIISDDADEVMPPPSSHLQLNEAEKTKLKAWIEQGAPYAGHWAFIPPKKSELPAGFSGNPIDYWVEKRLIEEDLQPSKEADRGMLIRRVSLDLTGLPPSAEEVEAFLKDDSADAYSKLVDRLMQSPHFGERLAVEWLDSARYADTNGFSIDGGRHLWLWRDWVIQAFNDNLPYDRFLLEQIAGDLLPDRTEAQLIATGFQRNNMVTHEGGTIPDENITNYNADRVKTLGESVLGLTLGCAQCHDHKFDPITQRDYYQIFAFFNSLSDKGLDGNGGVNPGPSIEARTVLRTDEASGLREQIERLKKELDREDSDKLTAWEKREQEKLGDRGKNFSTHPIKATKVSTPNRGAGLEVEEDGQRVRLSDAGPMGAFDILTELPKIDQPIAGVRVVIHPVATLPGGGWGSGPDVAKKPRTANANKRAKPPVASKTLPQPTENAKKDSDSEEKPDAEKQVKGTFMLTALAATADSVPGDQINLFKILQIARVTANSWDVLNPPSGCLDPRNHDGWSPDLSTEGPVHLTATFKEPIDAKLTPFFTVQLNFGNGRSLVPELIELQAITGHDDGTDLPDDIVAVLQTPVDRRTAESKGRLWQYCAAHSDEMKAQRITLANLEERLNVLTQRFTTMVMDVAEKPRETHILQRGDYSKPTDKVSAATPGSLPSMPSDATPDRLGLARWATMKEHPLTARVAVNRLWKMLFGTGLVATAADFGSQGEWPSHPELLDQLAVDFVESGWDVKAIIRTIVLSKAYRQTSATPPDLIERDPQNRLLARGPRFRLSAEFIRDSALKISRLLVPRIGGPSVNPYTPGDLWREVSHYGSTPATAQTFVQDHGEKLYRRSLYTFWKRTAPPPNMMAFDAPNREVCTVARGNTTTPLQALVTLNDIQFVEASRAFAQRILLKKLPSDRDRLRWAFLEATSRVPSDDECKILLAAVDREQIRYASQPAKAEAYLSVGESPIDSTLDLNRLAAWSQVGSILLNLSETVTRN